MDARAAKLQRTHGPDDDAVLSIEMLDDYDAFESRFRAELRDRIDSKGQLDLGETNSFFGFPSLRNFKTCLLFAEHLPAGSSLEMCCILVSFVWQLACPNELNDQVSSRECLHCRGICLNQTKS